jgi:hypothetical protein
MMTSKVVPKTRLAWNVEGKGLHKPALIVYLYYKKKKIVEYICAERFL